MEFLGLLFPLIVLGGLALLVQYLPIAQPYKTVLYVVLGLIAVVVVFRVLGIPTRFP